MAKLDRALFSMIQYCKITVCLGKNGQFSNFSPIDLTMCSTYLQSSLLHFVVFFHVALLLSTGVDNEKALDLTNSTVFHKSIDNEKVLELDNRICFSYCSLI